MDKLELLRIFLNDNLNTIQNGTRENAISLLKTFCEDNNVLTYDEAYEAHYLFVGEADDPESMREQAVDWMQQANCSEGGGSHAFQKVYVAPTFDAEGFEINVCVHGGDAFYYKERPAYEKDYSGQMDVGFYCSQLILDTDADFSCFLPEDEEKAEDIYTEELIVEDSEVVEDEEETSGQNTETTVPTTSETVRNQSSAVPIIIVGVLFVILVFVMITYFKKLKKDD